MMALEFLTSDLLAGTRHGFFTRRGGASSGIYAGLNCGPGSSDQREAVALNRARVAEALGVPRERLLSLHQVHSTEVVVAGPEGWAERPRADAMVTAHPGVALGILTADCAPVLFHDPEAAGHRRRPRRLARRRRRRARGHARRDGKPRRRGSARSAPRSARRSASAPTRSVPSSSTAS